MNRTVECFVGENNIVTEKIKVVSYMGKRYFEIDGLGIKFYWIDPIHEWLLGLGGIHVNRNKKLFDSGHVVSMNLESKDSKRGNEQVSCFIGLNRLLERDGKRIEHATTLYSRDFREGDEIIVRFIRPISHDIKDLAYYIKTACDTRLKIEELKLQFPGKTYSRLLEIIAEKEGKGESITIQYPPIMIMDRRHG